MALFKKAAPSVDTTKVDTLIGAEAFFQGTLNVKGSLRVDGRVEGSIVGAQSVIVGAGGLVKGDVTADFIVVGGKVQGDVTATELVELLAPGQVAGDLCAPRLLIEEGATFDGACRMTSKSRPETEPSRPGASKLGSQPEAAKPSPAEHAHGSSREPANR